MKKCPFCAEDIQDEAIVCKHCGRDLVAVEPPPRKKRNLTIIPLVLLFGILIIAIGGSTWYYFYGPCGVTLVAKSVEQLDDITDRWTSKLEIAGSTARISLTNPVSDLQDLRNETKNLEVPVCLEESKEHLLEAQDYAISAFLAFMSEESDIVVENKFNSSNNYFNQSLRGIIRITECTPFCE